VVKRLISEGVSLDEQNTAFVEAASKGNATIVKLFCKARSDLTAKNLIVWTALEAAITRGHGEVVSVLAEQQLDFTTLHPSGSTYLQLAVTSGHAEVVRALSNNGVALNQLMDNGFTPIYSAAHDGHVKVVEVLADKVPGFLTPLRAGWGPLHIAALNGHVEVVRFLISRGADFTSATEDGWFPIDMAISNQSTGVVSFLFNCGAVPSEVTANGSTPLFIAAEGGNLELTRLLVAHGAKVDATNARGWTALNVACARGHFEVVKYLVGVGAEFSAASLEGWTPLNSAASEGFLEITKFLADKGADIHRQNADGWTPLLSAALGGYVEIVSFLAERGADPLAQTTAGVTPMAGAGARGHTEVVKLLNDLQSRVWMKTFSPLVAQCDTTPYRPLPPNILNHASWTSRTSYIGDRSAPKLFAYSQYLGVTGSGTGRFSFVLHNGPTNKHSALAAGGEIANGSQRKSLDSVIHVAAQPGSLETQQGVVTNIIMRAGIVGDGEMTVFRYTIKPTLRLGNDNAPHLAQVDFEWRRMPRNPADKQSYHKEMYLYQIQGQDKVGQNAIAPNVETERHPIAAPWAKFDITSRFETSNSFNFHFLRAMDNRTAIIALATAIQIWYMGTAGYINTGKIKGLLGYGKKETETPAST
jgi:ankyrin repeat protein